MKIDLTLQQRSDLLHEKMKFIKHEHFVLSGWNTGLRTRYDAPLIEGYGRMKSISWFTPWYKGFHGYPKSFAIWFFDKSFREQIPRLDLDEDQLPQELLELFKLTNICGSSSARLRNLEFKEDTSHYSSWLEFNYFPDCTRLDGSDVRYWGTQNSKEALNLSVKEDVVCAALQLLGKTLTLKLNQK